VNGQSQQRKPPYFASNAHYQNKPMTLLAIVAAVIESGGFDRTGGTLWTQLLADGEIEMPRIETKSQCEVPDPSPETRLVAESDDGNARQFLSSRSAGG
jgi:hypothetical protein